MVPARLSGFHVDEAIELCEGRVTDSHTMSTRLMKRDLREPSDFDWGESRDAGAMNLALAILWDVLGERPEGELYKRFAVNVIKPLPLMESWSLREDYIHEWLNPRTTTYDIA